METSWAVAMPTLSGDISNTDCLGQTYGKPTLGETAKRSSWRNTRKHTQKEELLETGIGKRRIHNTAPVSMSTDEMWLLLLLEEWLLLPPNETAPNLLRTGGQARTLMGSAGVRGTYQQRDNRMGHSKERC